MFTKIFDRAHEGVPTSGFKTNLSRQYVVVAVFDMKCGKHQIIDQPDLV